MTKTIRASQQTPNDFRPCGYALSGSALDALNIHFSMKKKRVKEEKSNG